MGSVFSSVMMITVSLASGDFSALAANEARKKNWAKAKMWGYIALGATFLTMGLALALIIKSKSSSGAAGAMTVAPGFDFGVVLMIIIMAIMSGLDIYGIIQVSTSTGQKTKKGEEMFAISSTVGFGGSILALIIIVFLA